MLRLFISVDLKDPAILKEIKAVTEETKQLKGLRLTNPELLHFTLKFLGDTPETKVKVINNALSSIQWATFTITLQGLGVFPKPSFPRIFWVGVSSGQQLFRDLAKKVDQALGNEGFSREKRSFSPHLTIGRFKSRKFQNEALIQILKDFKDIEFGQLVVDEINLTESTLTPQGPIYETLTSFPATPEEE